METIDVGQRCCFCGEDTSFGSGKFVNRIPCSTDTETDVFAEGQLRHGYQCAECQMIDCFRCGELTLEYEIFDITDEDGLLTTEVVCPDCMTDDEVEKLNA